MLRRILVGLLLVGVGVVSIEAMDVGPEFPTERIEGIPVPFRMHVDEVSASYRTGEIDEAIARVPDPISALVRSDPATGIEELARFLRDNGGSAGAARDEYHLVKRLHDWITSAVAYDVYLFEGREGHEGSRDPLEFLTFADGARTTCTGFSTLFQMLASAAGVESRVVSGRARSYGSYAGGAGNHTWNAVRINDRWYIVDTTADGRMRSEGAAREEREEYSDAWLFVSPEAMLIKNWPDEFDDQFIDDPISYESFAAMPLFELRFLESGLRPASGAMDTEGLFEGRTRVAVPRAGGNLYDWHEYYETSDGRYSVELLVPRESFVYAQLSSGGEGALLDAMAAAGSLETARALGAGGGGAGGGGAGAEGGGTPGRSGPSEPAAGVAFGASGELLGVPQEQEVDHRTLVEYAPYNDEYRRATITWSLPVARHGRQFFRARYLVRPFSLEEPGATVYSFYLRAGSRDGERLPDENVLVPQSSEQHFGVRVGTIEPLEGGAFAVHVQHPPEVEIGGRLAAISNVPVERHHFRSHPAPGVTRYVVTPPAPGEYVLRLLAKERDAAVYNHAIALYRFRSSEEGLRHLPYGEIDLEPEFHELGLEVVERVLLPEGAVYELQVDAPGGVHLTGTLTAIGPDGGALRDSAGEPVRPVLHDSVDVWPVGAGGGSTAGGANAAGAGAPGAATLGATTVGNASAPGSASNLRGATTPGDATTPGAGSIAGPRRYHFSFSPGLTGTAHDGFRDAAARPDFAGFVARVFREHEGSYTAVATFYIPSAANGEGPLLPRAGTMARRAALYEYGLSVRTHNVAGAASEGYLELTVDYPPGVELASGLYDTAMSSRGPDGEFYTRGNRILSYAVGSWTAYVRPPDDGHYVFRVFARDAGTERYATVLEIPVAGEEFAGARLASFPPLWHPVLSSEFAAEGFVLREVSLTSEDPQTDRELSITVSAPPEVEMRAIVRDVRGNNLDDRTEVASTPTDSGTRYVFTFTLPANPRGEPSAIRIYRYDGEYRLRMSIIVE